MSTLRANTPPNIVATAKRALQPPSPWRKEETCTRARPRQDAAGGLGSNGDKGTKGSLAFRKSIEK